MLGYRNANIPQEVDDITINIMFSAGGVGSHPCRNITQKCQSSSSSQNNKIPEAQRLKWDFLEE